jgi:RNA polymerase sigma-70 factor (ECF subfamily)
MWPERLQFQLLIDRARHGDESAARELFELFEPHVRRVIRSRLPHVMRSKFDSIDFVQSVLGDFFGRLHRGEIDFKSPRDLAKFLTLAAQARVANEFRHRLRTKKHDLNKEVSIDHGHQHVPLISHDPSPSQVAVAQERLEGILEGRPQLHQEVLRLRGEGFTFAEIADRTGIDERSARRILHRVEKELGLNDAGQ